MLTQFSVVGSNEDFFFLRLSLQRPLGQKIKECCQGSTYSSFTV